MTPLPFVLAILAANPIVTSKSARSYTVPCDAACESDLGRIAAEAVSLAKEVPAGQAREETLQVVSRNLRWFGQSASGIAAAQAMTGETARQEFRAAVAGTLPRYTPVSEIDPTDACHDITWITGHAERSDEPGLTVTQRVSRCFDGPHEFGGPPRDRAFAVFAALPVGKAKATLLAAMIMMYQEPETTRFATVEWPALAGFLDKELRAGIGAFLTRPEALFWLGRTDEALAAARREKDGWHIASLIEHLLETDRIDDAIALLPVLAKRPPDMAIGGCDDWFSDFGLLQRLSGLIPADIPEKSFATFLERLPASPAYRAICPAGMSPDAEVAMLRRAGRIEAAIARSLVRGQPMEHVGFLNGLGRDAYAAGRIADARAYWLSAVDALPPVPAAPDTRSGNFVRYTGVDLVESLSAAGALKEAESLARRYPNRAWRAIMLSAAVAGRSGLATGDTATQAESADPEHVPLTPDAH